MHWNIEKAGAPGADVGTLWRVVTKHGLATADANPRFHRSVRSALWEPFPGERISIGTTGSGLAICSDR